LCAVVAVAIVFATDRRRENMGSASVLIAAIVAALTAAILTAGELSRFWSAGGQPGANGLGTRSELWTAAYRLWERHPWLGIGAVAVANPSPLNERSYAAEIPSAQ